MKLVLVAIAAGLTYIYTNDVTIPYYYKGHKPAEIQAGLNKWNSSGIYFQRVVRHPALTIKHTQINSTEGGWYENNTIYINNLYHFNDRDLISLVGHESGHFIGLLHSAENTSIMKRGYPYISEPNEVDINKAFWLKPLLFLKKFI